MTQNKPGSKKIVFAAGGTGGHLFPAQALAEILKEKDANIDVFFAGTGLKTSAYFDRTKFPHAHIASGTPFTNGIFRKVNNAILLINGIIQSLKILSKERPKLVIGFGSFHAFPVLCAAVLKRVPIILFESNAIPGKVIRLFSRFSLFTAIHFSEAKSYLKSKTYDVQIPSLKKGERATQESARKYFDLDPQVFTLLVFGGSQGAKKINQSMIDLIPRLGTSKVKFQLIHFTGNKEVAEEIVSLCKTFSIPCCIKPFEPCMDFAWSAADVVICRAGAATLSEMIYFGIPGILIPFPHAADQHQLKNARYVEKTTRGVKIFEEGILSLDELQQAIQMLSAPESNERKMMKQSLREYHLNQNKSDFAALVLQSIEKTHD